MRNKKFIASLMLASILASSAMPVYANTNAISSANQDKSETSAQVPSELDIPPTLEGITVSIPENLNLTYNSDSGHYEAESSISAKGDLTSGYVLELSTPYDVYYDLDGNVVTARVSKFDENCLYGYTAESIWTSDDLKAGTKERPIKLTTTDDSISVKGSTTAKVNFNISLQKLWGVDNQYYAFDTNGGGFNPDGTAETGSAYITNIYSADLKLPKYIRGSDNSINYCKSTDVTFADSSSSTPKITSNTQLQKVKSIEVPYSSTTSLHNNSNEVFPNLESLTLGNFVSSNISNLKNLKTLTIKNVQPRYSISPECIYTDFCNINNLPALTTVTLPKLTNFRAYTLVGDDFGFCNCPNLADIYYAGTKEDVKNFNIYSDTDHLVGTFGDYDFSNVSDTNSSLYILGHATWHCSDGDYVPADAE